MRIKNKVFILFLFIVKINLFFELKYVNYSEQILPYI